MPRLTPQPLPKPQIPREPSSVWDEADQVLENPYEAFNMIPGIPLDDTGTAAPIEGRTELKFKGNPEEGHISNLQYLQRVNNPEGTKAEDGVTISVDADKNVWAIPKGETKYYRLDPPPISRHFYKDIWNDVKDVAGDAALAIPTTLAGMGTAAVLGSTWPALLTGGLVAGAAGATAEGVRQLMGEAEGFQNDPNNIYLMGATNALMPPLFNKLQKFTPAALGALSGTPTDAVRTAFNRYPEMFKIDKATPTKWAEDIWEKTLDPIIKNTQAHGKNLDAQINAAGKSVNIAEAKLRMYGVMQRFETKMNQQPGNPQAVEAYNRARAAYFDVFGQTPKDITEEFLALSPQKQQELLAMEEVVQKTVNTRGMGLDEAGLPQTTTRYYRQIQPDEMIPSAAYDKSRAIGLKKGDYKKADTTEAVSGRFAKSDKSSISDDPVMLAMDEAKGHIDKGLDNVTNGMAANIRSEYARMMRLRRILDKHFNDKQQAWSTLRNINQALSKQELRDINEEVLKESGMNLKDEGSLVSAHHFFGDTGMAGAGPSLFPLGNNLGTSTGRWIMNAGIGGGLGTASQKALGGFTPGGIQVGEALPFIGALGSNFAFGPAGLRKAMPWYYYSKALHPAIRTGVTGAANDAIRKNPWTLMDDYDWQAQKEGK